MVPQDNEAEDPPVPPALAPGQWARNRFGVETWGEVHAHSSGELTVRSIDQPVIFRGRDRHALAGLALHDLVVDGRSVGFTREDVMRLRLLLTEGWPMSTAVANATGLTSEWATSLAARIDAMLPPEAPVTLSDYARANLQALNAKISDEVHAAYFGRGRDGSADAQG